MEFLDLVLNRQSAREYNGKQVEKETLEKIVEIARNTPSACNSQPWKMVVVTNNEIGDKVREALTVGGRNPFLKDVKTFICLVEEPTVLMPGINVPSDYYTEYDIGELIAYITLAAESLGVSSCIIGRVDSVKIKDAISLNDNENCKIAIALGYSNTPKRAKKRKNKEETVSFIC